jgi:hypothetical protein
MKARSLVVLVIHCNYLTLTSLALWRGHSYVRLLRFPLSKEEVLETAGAIAKLRGNPFQNAAGTELPSEKWWSAFRKRHKGRVKVSRGSKLKAGQAELTRKDLDDTYDLVQEL